MIESIKINGQKITVIADGSLDDLSKSLKELSESFKAASLEFWLMNQFKHMICTRDEQIDGLKQSISNAMNANEPLSGELVKHYNYMMENGK